MRHRLKRATGTIAALRLHIKELESISTDAVEQVRESSSLEISELFAALLESEAKLLVANGESAQLQQEEAGLTEDTGLAGSQYSYKDEFRRVRPEVRDTLVELGVKQGLSGCKAFAAMKEVLQGLGVHVLDDISDTTTMFRRVVVERSVIHQLDFAKRLLEGAGLLVPVDKFKPPEGALCTKAGARPLLARVRVSGEDTTGADDGETGYDTMVTKLSATWLNGSDNPPDPTAGEQTDVSGAVQAAAAAAVQAAAEKDALVAAEVAAADAVLADPEATEEAKAVAQSKKKEAEVAAQQEDAGENGNAWTSGGDVEGVAEIGRIKHAFPPLCSDRTGCTCTFTG